MKHLNWDDIWAYVDSNGSDCAPSIRAHIVGCAVCQGKLQTAQTANKALVSTMQLDAPQPSLGDDQRLLQVLSNGVGELGTPRRNQRIRSWLLPVTSTAAVAIFMIGVGTFLVHKATNSPGGHMTASSATTPSGDMATASSPTATSASAVNGSLQKAAEVNQTADTAASLPLSSLSVHVQSPTGAALAGVRVAFVVTGNIVATSQTQADGTTPSAQMRIPVDGVLAPSFNALIPPQGYVTLVAWKDGYQGIVSYEVGVPLGTTLFSRTLTMAPSQNGSSIQVLPLGSIGYHILATGNYAKWAHQMAGDRNDIKAPLADGAAGKVRAQVLDQDGHRVSGAEVIVTTGNFVSGKSVTQSNGESSAIPTVGMPDWWFLMPGAVAANVPQVSSIVVWKDGFAPAVGLFQPVQRGATRDVIIRLQSIAWRKSQDMNNADAPTDIPGEVTPSEQDALRLYQWVIAQVK
jgi:hypothetical protein